MNQRMLQFLKSTSIKGVPRIFQTKSYFLRTLWTISTISFISMAVYQTCLLTREYLEYPTIVSIKERNLDLVGATHQAIRLPDITLCNMNPFAVDTRNITSLPSLESYYLRVREITECTSCTQEEQNSLWELRQALQTTSGYYTHIGRNNVQRISHREDMFLASCTLEVAKGMNARKVRCERIATIERYIDSMYYNCYTLQIPPATPTDIVWGVVVVLHLNNHHDILEQQKYLASHYMPGQMAGAVMAFHEHDQEPVLVLTGISLPPGQYMSTKLRFILNKRMEHPYGICRHYDSTISYHQMSCYSTCLQKEVYRECGCYEYTGWNPLIEDSDLDGPPCLSLKRGKQWLYEKWRCLKEVHIRSSTEQNCKFLCPIPCEQFLYDYDVSCRHLISYMHLQNLQLFSTSAVYHTLLAVLFHVARDLTYI